MFIQNYIILFLDVTGQIKIKGGILAMFKNNLLLFTLLFLGIIISPVFAAEEQVTVELMWESGETQGYERDVLNSLIEDFEEEHPGIKIKNNPFVGSSENYQAKLLTRLSAEAGPDMYSVGDNTLFRYAKAGMAEPVPEQLANSLKNDFTETLRDGMVSGLSWEGQLYGVPWNADYVSLWYNKDMFKEAGLTKLPSNLEELREYAIKLTKRENGRVVRSGISLRSHTGGAGQTDKWINFLTAMGGELFNKEMTETVINNKAGVKALEYFVDLIYEDKVDAVDLQPRDSDGFAQKKTAMFGRGPWVLAFLKDAAPDLNYGVAPFPGKSIPFIDALCVSDKSKEKEAAWTFLEWLMKPEVFARWQKEIGSIPLLQSIADMPYFQNNEILSGFAMQPLWDVPQHEKLYEIKIILGDYLEKACYKKLTPQEALDQAAKEISKILQED